MTLRTRSVLVFLALVMFAYSVVFIIATLAGLTVPSTLWIADAAIGAVAVATIVTILVPATIVQEDRLTIRAPHQAVYAAIADPRPGPRRTPEVVAVDDLVGEPGAVGSRWRTTLASGMVFTSEVVAAEPPARLVIRSQSVPRWPRRRTVIETERLLMATPAGTELTIRGTERTTLLSWLVERLQRSQSARLRRWLIERFRDELEANAENRKAALPS
jgi:uncharacterized protein YndB with AHSA1/START domain